MSRIGVMQMIDSLAPGGAERVAVNLANALPRDRYDVSLCTTRHDGPLAELLAPDVARLRLNRKRTIEAQAMARLSQFLRQRRIRLLHAHSSALLIANLASLLPPYPVIVWHDHFGREPSRRNRLALLYRLMTRRVRAVVAVSRPLADWSRDRLRVPAERVWYVPNFVCDPKPNGKAPELPGTPGLRIVCVANFRPQKDHSNLLQSMAAVVQKVPAAHLLLIGEESDPTYVAYLKRQIDDRRLQGNVSILGPRHDVAVVLAACDVAVLSSASEGLPLALLEYGLAGLATVSTDVGECPDVLDSGRCGLLVPPGDPERLADALLDLLTGTQRRAVLGSLFREHVRRQYSAAAMLRQLETIYDTALREDAVAAHQ